LALLLVLSRLVPVALAAGLFTRLALGLTSVPARDRAALSALVAAGVLFHGSLSFVPDFDPYDVEVHVRRAVDLGRVPLRYDALLRYGSHLPTETQTFGTATLGLVLLALVAADARALPAPSRRGLAAALVLGGLAAGLLFYFHYLPGLFSGIGAIQQEPDPFQARTYFIFHNESRQSMKVWAAG